MYRLSTSSRTRSLPRRRRNPFCTVLAAVVFGGSGLIAQNEFVNFETGQVRPIATCTVKAGANERHLLLICNTPADQLEIRDAVGPNYGLIAAIPTGMRPVTVRWNETWKRAYVCNFLGDSVTAVQITGTAGAGGTVNIDPKLLFTQRVGDEPTDIAFPTGRVALVTLKAKAAIATCAVANMAPVVEERYSFPLPLAGGVPGMSGHVVMPKHPWMLELNAQNDRLFLLDHMDDDREGDVQLVDFTAGTKVAVSGLDAVMADLDSTQPLGKWISEATGKERIRGLGTTQHAMALNDNQSLLFVVASQARHLELLGESTLKVAKTGFVQSWLRVVQLTGGPPTVRGEHVLGSPRAPSINLNRDYTQTGLEELAPALALAQPTGLTVIDGGAVPTLCITAFGSDRVAFLTFDSNTPGGWDITRIDLLPRSGYGIAGPRAAFYDAYTDQVFVSRQLDNAFTVFDAASPASSPVTVGLAFDPRPAVVTEGHPLLYSAKHSGNHAVSCASCHIDGATDGLAWDLSDPTNEPIPEGLVDRFVETLTHFPPDKGTIVTQTLQGLLNFPVAGDDAADLFSNRPYHWRADREDFEAFEPAFANLMNGSIAAGEMTKFRRLVDTIMHAPNPYQPLQRQVLGDYGDPAVETDGTGSLRGMEAFLTQPTLLDSASCVHCHSFPEGSNNRITEKFGDHPLETAAVRNIFARESVFIDSNYVPAADDVLRWFRLTGLNHDNQLSPPPVEGIVLNESINHFLTRFFNGNGQPLLSTATREFLNQFIREWDTGPAPITGYVRTLDGTAGDSADEALMVSQVEEANAGLVAFARQGTAIARYWYDLTLPGAMRYRLGNSTTAVDFAALQAIASNAANTVVLQSVPIGSAQAVATQGQPIVPDSPAHSIVLQPMAPPTHMVDVSVFTGNWSTPPAGVLPSVRALQSLQDNVLTPIGHPDDVGINHDSVEPTRRFRVTGDHIAPGAVLVISGGYLPATIELPIFPTKYVASGKRIWETAVEADDRLTLALLNGGPDEPWVRWVLALKDPNGAGAPNPPVGPHSFLVTVKNKNPMLPVATPTSQVLKVQDQR